MATRFSIPRWRVWDGGGRKKGEKKKKGVSEVALTGGTCLSATQAKAKEMASLLGR
jgi:hypothetical protein